MSYCELLRQHDNVLPWIITYMEEGFHNETSLKNHFAVESQSSFIMGVVKRNTKNLKDLKLYACLRWILFTLQVWF